MLLLLTSPDFRQVVIQWADARNGRPPGAEPEDLMASARDRRTALGYTGGAEPALFDKAKLFVAAVFGAEARDSEDARTALTHLHRKPCMRASKVPCHLCTVHLSFSRRWKALVKDKPLTDYALSLIHI